MIFGWGDPGWGNRGCPLLPTSLREIWASESLPAWVATELGLPAGAGYSSLSADVWSFCNLTELLDPVKKFFINLVRSRQSSISTIRALAGPWPQSLDPALLPWSSRTRNCLRKKGLLTDVSRLSLLTYGELLRMNAMGVVSVLDFACIAETAVHAGVVPCSAVDGNTDDEKYAAVLLDAIDAPWSPQISNQDPRFASLLSPGDETVFEILERLTSEPQDPLPS